MNTHDLSLSLVQALVRAQGEAAGRRGESPARPAFTVAISREAGAQGNSVAAEVGRRLGWAVYDKEILEKVAEEMRRPAAAADLQAVDERPASWLEDSLSLLLTEHSVLADTYFKHLIAAVRGLGLVGRCVIVGRGANFILPAETTLRVRLLAAAEDREKAVAARLGLPPREARAWVERSERERAAFVKQHFRVDPTDPHHYDLVLNMSRLSVPEAADLIVRRLRQCEEGSPGEKATRPRGGGAEG
jgi:cytidylate kinase